MKLNLGCGELELPGYENWDRKNGHEAYPLDVPDGSLWELRASHILEHFSHREVGDVFANWVSKLQPGGCLKIAVPNFEVIATEYLQNRGENTHKYVMGSHSDANDFHGSIFDRADIFDLFARNNMERIGPWMSEIDDCASHRYSLNVQGFKPSGVAVELPRGEVFGGLAAPRFAPVEHFKCLMGVMVKLGIGAKAQQGCYWHQNMSELMELAVERGAKYFLSLDYDTIFSSGDVMELYRLMEAFPEADAIASVQSKRHSNCALFSAPNPDGSWREPTPQERERPLMRIYTAHFGLTMFRCESLKKFPRPWMRPEPNADGRWADGKLDADISFWHNWNHHGLKLFLANRVVVGHMSEMIEWPDKDYRAIVQPLRDYEKEGIPAGVCR